MLLLDLYIGNQLVLKFRKLEKMDLQLNHVRSLQHHKIYLGWEMQVEWKEMSTLRQLGGQMQYKSLTKERQDSRKTVSEQ